MLRYFICVLVALIGVVCGTFLAPWVPWSSPGTKTISVSQPNTMSLDQLVELYKEVGDTDEPAALMMLQANVSTAETDKALVVELRDRLRSLTTQAEADVLVKLAGWFRDEPHHILAEALKQKLPNVDTSLQWHILASLRKMGSFPEPDKLLPLMSSDNVYLRECLVMWTRMEYGAAGKQIFIHCLNDDAMEVRASGFGSCRVTGVDVRSQSKEWLHSFLRRGDAATLRTLLYEGPRDVRECIRYLENAYGVAPPSRHQYLPLGTYAKTVLEYVDVVDAAREKAQAVLVKQSKE